MSCSCGCGQVTPIARRNRAELGHVKGEHVPFVPGHRPGISVGFGVEDRGYRTACHIWRGVKIVGGYGRVSRAGEKLLAHVVAYEKRYGPVPVGTEVDHRCGQPSCVNTEHLEAVSHAVNCRRGRATRLTFEQAQAIKHGRGDAAGVAAAFGVSRSTVQSIRAGRLWRDA